jgi:hypothetical protein
MIGTHPGMNAVRQALIADVSGRNAKIEFFCLVM